MVLRIYGTARHDVPPQSLLPSESEEDSAGHEYKTVLRSVHLQLPDSYTVTYGNTPFFIIYDYTKKSKI